ncbi:MAG: quinone-dependent dihydroorotate dehydrogenase [Chthoniobacterales bacterium]|nr:quinone-dependent dihydroorotate dehydrogenase [Chthoniobacterales bacterium]
MNFYREILRPILFLLPAEAAHNLTLQLLRSLQPNSRLLNLLFGQPISLPLEFCGLHFRNPVGLAAGMDKNASAIPAWEALGFGFVEIGTITSQPQAGNPKPRLFRYPHKQALVNRMGFNNDGCELVAKRLQKLYSSKKPNIPIGINIGKLKSVPNAEAPSDYLKCYKKLYDYADFFVVNVSSPNTPGLRSLQSATELERILVALRSWEAPPKKPLWVKLSPDLTPEDALAATETAALCGANAIVATNTTLDHDALLPYEDQEGGLSCSPLREKAVAMLKLLIRNSKLPVVASGGIMSPEDAAERMRLGASLIELYTGLIYSGPSLIREILNYRQKPPSENKTD